MHAKPASFVPGRRVAGLWRRFGLVVAVWAVTGQIAFGGTMLVEAARARLGAQNFICHVGDGGTAPAGPHHGADCDTCPLCQAFAEAHVLSPLAAAPALPPPSLAWQRRDTMRPPARAPPAFTLAAAWPRGPPA